MIIWILWVCALLFTGRKLTSDQDVGVWFAGLIEIIVEINVLRNVFELLQSTC